MRGTMTVLDLTQLLGPDTVPWVGSDPVHTRPIATYEPDGAYCRRLELDEHYGTHVDAPSHFHPGGRHLHELAAEELVLAAVLVDCREACGEDRDFALDARAIEAFEREHGWITTGALVLACTGWDRFRGDAGRYIGDPPRFPGYAPDAAELLVERGVAAIGIDTLGVDRGVETSFPVHHITSPAGVWHIEGLVGLDRLPPTGATVVVGALPLVDGSGAPARVLALLP